MKSFAIANGLGQLSQFASLGFILFVLPWFIHVPVPMLSTYVLTCTFISLPMQNLLNRIPELMRGNIALKKIERMKLSLDNHSEFDTEPATTQPHCQLELDRVTYLYHPEPADREPPKGRPDGHPGDRPDDFPGAIGECARWQISTSSIEASIRASIRSPTEVSAKPSTEWSAASATEWSTRSSAASSNGSIN